MTTRTARRPRRPSRAAEPEPEEGYEPDPEENGDERPTRRSASRPSRRAAPSRRDDDEPRRGRGRSSRDEEDGGDDGDEDGGKESVGGGWGTWRQRRAETSGFADEFKVEYKEKYLIMFLDDAPFAAFNEHWIDEMPKGKKKSYVCIGKKAGCPLCVTLGEEPKAQALFNVLEFIETDDGREPVLKVWKGGSGVVQEIEEQSEDVGWLEGNYFKVSKSKSGKNGPTKYSVQHQKPRDVEEDPWNMDPLSDDEIEEWQGKRFDKSYVKMPSKKSLQEVADEVMALD